jgi:hypothetical protein
MKNKKSNKYIGYYRHGDYSRPERCCHEVHSSWQAAKSHAESQAYSGAQIIVYDQYLQVVVDERK